MLRLLSVFLLASLASGVHAQADGQPVTPAPPEASDIAALGAKTRADEPRTFAELAAYRAAFAPPAPEAAPSFYVVRERVSLTATPGGSPITSLRRRDGVRVLEEADGWRRVLYGETEGWLPSDAVSNVWIRIDKSERMTYVYRGSELWRTLPADVSANPEGDKLRQAARSESDEHKIPEGTFYVTRRHPTSSYYLAFVLSYPSPVHALRGLEQGLISQSQYEAIVAAHRDFREPPQGTRLGGLIEIHGHGTGRRRAWTRGCVALRNVHMDALWEIVEVGTPVIIEP